VGGLVSGALPTGPGQQNVTGGGHAAALAEQIANVVRGLKTTDPDSVVHIFAACPNSVLFFLGQQHQGIAPCVVYEFDFDRRGSKTYQPSFVID
jgi:SMODS-associated and fused to various effectors sensor domain